MNTIITCGTSDPSSKPCTLADLMMTTNNLATYIITYILPPLIMIGIVYTAIRMLLDINKPDALAKVKKNISYILWGTFFTVAAWSLMRVALNLIGWKGDISNPLGYILGIETAYAAPFDNPLANANVSSLLSSIAGGAMVFFSIVLASTMIYLGIRFMAYSDNPDKLKETKNYLLMAVIAGIIVFSITFISDVLVNTFTKLDTATKSSASTKGG